MAEFSLIDRYCKNIGARQSDTLLSVGDDAALIQMSPDQHMAISVDTMVAGVHFDPQLAPERLAHKILAVNLSDLAAMGAKPRWATLAMTLPQIDHDWLASFSAALDATANRFQLELIGGDTTQGPLTLTLQIMGVLPVGRALLRSGAQIDDDVYVSGQLGDAALALHCRQEPELAAQLNQIYLQDRLDLPEPQVALGRGLQGVASACIDVSDGLLADLQHICAASGVGITLEVQHLSLSSEYRRYLELGGDYTLALCGGDDYQLAFTAPTEKREQVADLAQRVGVSVSRVGQVTSGPGTVSVLANGVPLSVDRQTGWQHFVAQS